MAALIANKDIYTVVAETEGRIVGSNFLWENSVIASVGPLSVDPGCQDASVGRRLMQNSIKPAESQNN
jgi:predicted N-acetyltransferase YhbS